MDSIMQKLAPLLINLDQTEPLIPDETEPPIPGQTEPLFYGYSGLTFRH